jgi:uncharacterized protein YegP (UPF0339 family)
VGKVLLKNAAKNYNIDLRAQNGAIVYSSNQDYGRRKNKIKSEQHKWRKKVACSLLDNFDWKDLCNNS